LLNASFPLNTFPYFNAWRFLNSGGRTGIFSHFWPHLRLKK